MVSQYSSNPKAIADTVSSWIPSQEAALHAAHPSATLDIA